MEQIKKGSCALAKVLKVLGIIAIIAGMICAFKFTKDYSGYYVTRNVALIVMYIASGVITGMGFFSLSVIVDACKKYLDKD